EHVGRHAEPDAEHAGAAQPVVRGGDDPDQRAPAEHVQEGDEAAHAPQADALSGRDGGACGGACRRGGRGNGHRDLPWAPGSSRNLAARRSLLQPFCNYKEIAKRTTAHRPFRPRAQSTPRSLRSFATCPVALTLYIACSIRPSSPITNVDRITPTTVRP